MFYMTLKYLYHILGVNTFYRGMVTHAGATCLGNHSMSFPDETPLLGHAAQHASVTA